MKGFDCGLFPNTFKKGQNDPDATGSLRIPASVIAELYQGISGGTIPLKPGYGDGAEPCVELRAAAWRGDGSLTATGKQRPAISVRFDSPTEAAARDAARAQAAQQAPQGQQWGAPAPGGWGGAPVQQAPQGQQWGAPAPQAPAPAFAPAPQAPAPAYADAPGDFDTSIPF